MKKVQIATPDFEFYAMDYPLEDALITDYFNGARPVDR